MSARPPEPAVPPGPPLPRQDPVRALFERAAACDGPDRAALLAEARRIDPEACIEVEGMLRHLARDDGVLDRPAAEIVGLTPIPAAGAAESTLAAIEHERRHGTLPAGTRLGDWTITRLIGSGGSSVVHHAEHAQGARSAAIRLIRPELVTADMLERFEREAGTRCASLRRALDHPGLVPVIEVACVTLGGVPRPMIVSEFVDGLPLLDFVRGSSLGPAGTLELIAQVGEALHHAHERGVHHGALSGRSIIIAGRARVLDVGLAALLGPSRSDRFADAEAAGGDAVRGDVIALGRIMHELLTGRRPDPASDPASPRSAPSRFNPALRGELDAIILCATAPDPARRYASAAELAADIRRWLNGPHPGSTPPARTLRIPRRRLWGAIALATGAAAAGMATKAAWQWFRAR